MTCDELNERLTDVREGALPGDLCDEVQRHLESCHDCQGVRQDLEDLARLCRELSAPSTMPGDVRHRIEELLGAEGRPPRRPSA